MLIFCILYCLLLLAYLIALPLLMRNTRDEQKALPQELPFVSILIAARNEENNIGICLDAISKLSYPKSKIEILVGNDQSEDATEQVVRKKMSEYSNIRLINITGILGNAKGKANVLAHLAKQARGDVFFITDADIVVPTHWIESLLRNAESDTGIVSGCTISKPHNFLGLAQQLDWMYAFGMVKVVSDRNIPVTAVGNNMMIKRKAYEDVGGYETIPFSVTEDQELFLHVLKKGWKFKNLMNEECLAFTEPIESWKALLKQRRRWMKGAMKIPIILLFCLFLQGVALPMLVLTCISSPILGMSAWGLKILLQQVFLKQSFDRVGQKYSFPIHAFVFEIYSMVLSPLVVLNYFLSRKVEWKGRRYQ